jgi:flavin-dependent dehydrogenase
MTDESKKNAEILTFTERSIVVAGNGLSGTSAVLSLNQLGHQVRWLAPEIKEFDRNWPESVQLSGLLSLDKLVEIEPILKKCAIPVSSHYSCWGSTHLTQRLVSFNGAYEKDLILIDKQRLIHQLQLATNTENINRQSSKIRSFTQDRGAFIGELRDGESFKSRCAIDATGANSALLHSKDEISSIDHFHILCWQLSNAENTRIHSTFLEAAPTGWWYAAPRLHGGLSLFFATDLKQSTCRDVKTTQYIAEKLNETTHLKHWIKDLKLNQVSAPIIRHHSVQYQQQTMQVSNQTSKHAIFVAGDAAICLDPLSSHGSTNAIWSGLQVAECVDHLHQQWSTDRCIAYRKAIERSMIHHLNGRQQIYEQETRFRDHPFWTARRERCHLQGHCNKQSDHPSQSF